MADIVLDHVTKRYPGRGAGGERRQPRHRDGEFVILVGPSGCGKSTDAQHDRGAGGHHRRRAAHRREGGERQGAEGPRHRHGVPELRAVPAHDRAGEHGLRAQAGQDPQERHRREGQRGGPDPRPDPAPRPQAGQPVRRPAPAGGHGPGDRPRPGRVPHGRAAVQPRRQAARADAHRGLPDPAAPRHHHGLRHPRPDRGDDARRPGGGHAPRRAPAGRRRRRSCTTTRSTCSWPASSARRR